MNKTTKLYIIIIVCALAVPCTFAADMLDGYIGKFIAKADSKSDKLIKLVDIQQSESTNDPQLELKLEDARKTKLSKTKKLREDLKDSSLMSPPKKEASVINTQLQDVLSQLKSLSFSEMPETDDSELEAMMQVEPVIVVEPDPEPDLGSDDNSGEISNSKQVQGNDKVVVLIPEDASGVVDSFELAESLFKIGDKATALKYYEKAFSLSFPIGTKANPRRAWILFQSGNCLYGQDSVAAVKKYEQLIIEHPSSDWTNCARTKLQVLKWLLVEKPMALTMSEKK